jgi:hypothetical protein
MDAPVLDSGGHFLGIGACGWIGAEEFAAGAPAEIAGATDAGGASPARDAPAGPDRCAGGSVAGAGCTGSGGVGARAGICIPAPDASIAGGSDLGGGV